MAIVNKGVTIPGTITGFLTQTGTMSISTQGNAVQMSITSAEDWSTQRGIRADWEAILFRRHADGTAERFGSYTGFVTPESSSNRTFGQVPTGNYYLLVLFFARDNGEFWHQDQTALLAHRP